MVMSMAASSVGCLQGATCASWRQPSFGDACALRCAAVLLLLLLLLLWCWEV
jgi:hypothetical protein